MKLRSVSIALAGSVILAACSDQPTGVQPVLRHSAAIDAGGAMAGRYILSGNAFDADFAAKVAALGGSVERVHQAAGIAVVTGVSDAAASQLSSIAGVTDVQSDIVISIDSPVASAEADASSVATDDAASQANPTLASRYAWQWNMRQIGADKAWAVGKLGSPSVTVAILDTGIDYDVRDLAGLVDLSRSASFIASDDMITAKYFPTRNVISDYNGHGTNVATQVSSKGVALAGVTSKTTLIGVKVLSASGRGSLSAVLGGVLWAADHGANVANMSLGGGFSKAGNGQYVALINRTFNYANRKGMLIVVAAGNETEDLDHNGNELKTYCNQQHVICVAAEGPQTGATSDALYGTASNISSFYTNFGRSAIDVAGPGGNAITDGAGHVVAAAPYPWGTDIASWVWSFCSKTRIAGYATTGAPILTACAAGNRLSGFIGTSQATPHVAGLAALLVAEKGYTQPSQIKNAIRQSAIDFGAEGTDPFFGRGRISVSNALGL